MQSRSYLFLLIVLALGALAGIFYYRTTFNYGLDVSGGVRLTFEIDDSKLTAEQKTHRQEFVPKLRDILDRRVKTNLGVGEGTAGIKGQDQFVIEVPGYTDVENAKKVLGQAASIKWYDARTVKTRTQDFRPYLEVENRDTSGDKSLALSFQGPGGVTINPGTKEYSDMIASWGDPIVQGDEIENAQPEPRGVSAYRPLFTFSNTGSKKMEQWSRRHQNDGEKIAAVLDGVVLSIAPLKENTILSENAIIDGSFSPDYVRELCNLVNSGALPVDLKLLSSEKIDATVGHFALKQIIAAGVVAFSVVSLFLIIYYAFPGIVAVAALSLFVLFTLTVLKLIGATFSLAAIAGFVLSVAMAVDANILVFERFREELRHGKQFRSALELGFRRALPAIIDSNLCTVLTGLVLANYGTAMVKGFAVTLILGVLISFFTAVTVTRSLLMFFVGTGIVANPKWYAMNRRWFGEKYEVEAHHQPLQIVNNARKWFLISGLTIIPGIIFVLLGGIKPNVEFRGGYEVQFALSDPSITAGQISSSLDKAGLRGGNVKIAGEAGSRMAIISLPPQDQLKDIAQSQTTPNQTPATGAQPAPTVGANPATAEVQVPHGVQVIADAAGLNVKDERGHTQIGPLIQRETIYNAIMGVLLSSGLIIVYLGMRFGIAVGGFAVGWRFGASAIAALIHDVLVVIGLAAFMGFAFNWDISALFITSMLTIIGFSVHDTVVIFDRIRENLRRPNKEEDFAFLVNKSITQSFARSINTSMTVIVTLFILVVWGTATVDLKFFVLAMLVGIISGTYSSIYNASPILYLWDKAIEKRAGFEKSLVGLAIAEAKRVAGVATKLTVPTGPVQTTPQAGDAASGGRTYGTVRRRAKDQGKIRIDDDEP